MSLSTDDITKGVSFEKFAFEAANAFSYLARDVGSDKPLPDPEQAGNYYKDKLAQLQKEQKSVTKMSFNRAAKAAKKDFAQDKATYTGYIAKAGILSVRVKELLKQVEAYQPPATERHANHKKYMLDELQKTLERDGDPQLWVKYLDKVKELSPQEWKENKLKKIAEDIERSKEEINKAIERSRDDVGFVAGLRAAVKAQAPAPK